MFVYRQFQYLLEYLNEIPQEEQEKIGDVNVEQSFEVSESIMNAMTEKVFELYDMLDNADNDEYPNHVSEGSLKNAGTSLIRRMFLVANAEAILREFSYGPQAYPYVVVHQGFNEFISGLILRFWKLPTGFRKVMVCMLVYALYKDYVVTRYIQFNKPVPFAAQVNNRQGITGYALHDGLIHLIRNNPPGTKCSFEYLINGEPLPEKQVTDQVTPPHETSHGTDHGRGNRSGNRPSNRPANRPNNKPVKKELRNASEFFDSDDDEKVKEVKESPPFVGGVTIKPVKTSKRKPSTSLTPAPTPAPPNPSEISTELPTTPSTPSTESQ